MNAAFHRVVCELGSQAKPRRIADVRLSFPIVCFRADELMDRN